MFGICFEVLLIPHNVIAAPLAPKEHVPTKEDTGTCLWGEFMLSFDNWCRWSKHHARTKLEKEP